MVGVCVCVRVHVFFVFVFASRILHVGTQVNLVEEKYQL